MPPWLPALVVEIVVGHFPEAREDAMRRRADQLSKKAEQCRKRAKHFEEKAERLHHTIRGVAGERLEKQYLDSAERCRGQADHFDSQAEQLYEGANAFEVQKWTVIGFAVILAWTLTHAAITFAAGGAIEAYLAKTRTETALEIARRKLLEYLAGLSAKATAQRGTMYLAGKTAAIGAFQGGGINLAVQLKQVAYDQRESVDGKSVVITTVAGGAGGGAGAVAGKWVGDRWVIPSTLARAERATSTTGRVVIQIGGTVLTGGAGGLVGGLFGTAVAIGLSGEKFSLEGFTEGLLPAVAGGFLGAAAHGMAGLRGAGPVPAPAASGAHAGPARGAHPLSEALGAHGVAASGKSGDQPPPRQQQLDNLLAALLREPPAPQHNPVDWQPRIPGLALPDNVNSPKTVSFAHPDFAPTTAGEHRAGATKSEHPVSSTPEPTRPDSDPDQQAGGRAHRPAGELHARLLQRIAADESPTQPATATPDKTANAAARGHDVSPGRESDTRYNVAKSDKPTGPVTTEPNTPPVRTTDDAHARPGTRSAAIGDEATSQLGSGKAAELAPEKTAPQPRADLVEAPITEPAGTPAKATTTKPPTEPPGLDRTSTQAPPAKTSDPMRTPEPTAKPLAYPDRTVTAATDGPPPKPSTSKSEAVGDGTNTRKTTGEEAGEPAPKPLAEESGGVVEEGTLPNAERGSTDDFERAAHVTPESGAERTAEDSRSATAGFGQDPTPEAAELAARYKAEAEAILDDYAATDWSLVSAEGLEWMVRHGDDREATTAMIEIIHRGDPKNRVLRWTQVMAVLVARDGGVGNMQAGEGKTLVFLAAAALKAADGDPVKVITTRDVLANEAFDEYRTILGDFGFDIVRMNPDTPYADPVEGRSTIYIGTMNDAGFGELRGNIAPARRNGVDEIDEALVHADTTFVLSEGSGNPARTEVTAQVTDAHSFLTDAVAAGLLKESDFHRVPGRTGGDTALTEPGRAKIEDILGRPLTEEENHRLVMAATAEWEYVENDHYVVWHHPELGPEFRIDSAGKVMIGADGQPIRNPESHKIYIIDQTSHKVMFDAETSTESRWNGGLAQAIEAKHGIQIRDDPASSSSITAARMFSPEKSDELFGLSGTADGVANELRNNHGVKHVVDIPRFTPSQLKIAEDHIAYGQEGVISHQDAKLLAMSQSIAARQPEGNPQLAICNRNSEVAKLSKLLDDLGVEHVAVDAKFFLRHGAHAEAELQKIFHEAGKRGKVLVINRQGGRGVDIPVAPDIDAIGGLHVLISGRSAESRAVDIQAENRTARSGGNGSAQYFTAPDDSLYASAPEAQISVIRYTQYQNALAEHRSALAEHAAAPSRETREYLWKATNELETAQKNLAEANDNIRGLAAKLQPLGVRETATHDPVTTHLPHSPPTTDSAVPAHTPGQPQHRPPIHPDADRSTGEPTAHSPAETPASPKDERSRQPSAPAGPSARTLSNTPLDSAVAGQTAVNPAPGTAAWQQPPHMTNGEPAELRQARQGDRTAAGTLVQTYWAATLQRVSTTLGWDPATDTPEQSVRQLAHAMAFAGFRAVDLDRWALPEGRDLGDQLRKKADNTLLDGLGQLNEAERRLVTDALHALPRGRRLIQDQIDALERLTQVIHAQHRPDGILDARSEGVEPTVHAVQPIVAEITGPVDPLAPTRSAEPSPSAAAPLTAGTAPVPNQPIDVPTTPEHIADPARSTTSSMDPNVARDLRALRRAVVAAYMALEGLPESDPVVAALAMTPLTLFGQLIDRLHSSRQTALRLRFLQGLSEEQTAYVHNARTTTGMRWHATGVRTIAAGALRRLARSVAAEHGIPGTPELTVEELTVLELSAQDLPAALIARKLNLPRRTVAEIISRAAEKLNVPNRAAAVAEAIRRGDLDITTFPAAKGRAAEPFSAAAIDVLTLLAKGRTPAAVAAALSLRTAMVHRHLDDLGSRLGTHTPAGMVAAGIREGILDVNDPGWARGIGTDHRITAAATSNPRPIVTTADSGGRPMPLGASAFAEWPVDSSTLPRARAGDEAAFRALGRRYGRGNVQRILALLGWDLGRGIPPAQVTRLAHALHFGTMAFAGRNRWPVPAGQDIADWMFAVAQDTLLDSLARLSETDHERAASAIRTLHRGGDLTELQAAAVAELATQTHLRSRDGDATGPNAPAVIDEASRMSSARPVASSVIPMTGMDTAHTEPGVAAPIAGFDPALVTAIDPDDPIGPHTVIGRGKSSDRPVPQSEADPSGRTDSTAEDRGAPVPHSSGETSRSVSPGHVELSEGEMHILRHIAAGLPERILGAVLGLTPEEMDRILARLNSELASATVVRLASSPTPTGRPLLSSAQVQILRLLADDPPNPISDDTAAVAPDILRAFRTRLTDRGHTTLSERERTVLESLAQDGSVEETATILRLSVATVNDHLARAAGKLRTRGVIPTVLAAVRAGELDVDTESHDHVALSELEIRAVRMVANGEPSEAIRTALGVGRRRMRWLIAELYNKFGVDNKIRLALAAQHHGFLDSAETDLTAVTPPSAPASPTRTGEHRPPASDSDVDPTDSPVIAEVNAPATARLLLAPLSSRERSSLALLARGLSATEVGAKLGLSSSTVHSYAERAADKLGTKGLVPTILAAVRLGEIADDTGDTAPSEHIELSPLEARVVGMIAEGRTNRDIATAVGQDRTRPVLTALYRKFGITRRARMYGVQDRARLALAAQRHGLLALPSGLTASPRPAVLRQLRAGLQTARTRAELAQLFAVEPDVMEPGRLMQAISLVRQHILDTAAEPRAVAAVVPEITRWIGSRLELERDVAKLTVEALKTGAGEPHWDLVRERVIARNEELADQLTQLLGPPRYDRTVRMAAGDPLSSLREIVDESGSRQLGHLIDTVADFLDHSAIAGPLIPVGAVQVHALRRQLADALGIAVHELDPRLALALGLDVTEPDREPTYADIAEVAGVSESFVGDVLGRDEPLYTEPAQRVLIAAHWLGRLEKFEEVIDPAFAERRFIPPRFVDGEFRPGRFTKQPRQGAVTGRVGVGWYTVTKAFRGLGDPDLVRRIREAADAVGYWYHPSGHQQPVPSRRTGDHTPGAPSNATRPGGGRIDATPGPTTAYDGFAEVDVFGNRVRRGATATYVPTDAPMDLLAFAADPNTGLVWHGPASQQPVAPDPGPQQARARTHVPRTGPKSTEEQQFVRWYRDRLSAEPGQPRLGLADYTEMHDLEASQVRRWLRNAGFDPDEDDLPNVGEFPVPREGDTAEAWAERVRRFLGFTPENMDELVGTPAGTWKAAEQGNRRLGTEHVRAVLRRVPGARAAYSPVAGLYPALVTADGRPRYPEGYDRIGEYIRFLRESAGMRKAEFNRRLGKSKNTADRWESGTARPGMDDTINLMEMLVPHGGVTYDEVADNFTYLPRKSMVIPDAAAAESFAEYLRYLRRVNRISLADAGELLGISAEAVRRQEAGLDGARGELEMLRLYDNGLYEIGAWNRIAASWGYSYRMNPHGETAPHPDDHKSLHDWVRALRLYRRMPQSEVAALVGVSEAWIGFVERGSMPTVEFLRKLRDAAGIPNELLVAALRQFVCPKDVTPGDPVEERLFWELIASSPGSPEEQVIRNRIYEKYSWVPKAVVPRGPVPINRYDDLLQQAAMAILTATRNFVPPGGFAPAALAAARFCVLRDIYEHRYPNVEPAIRNLLIKVDGHLARRIEKTGTAPTDEEIGAALGLDPAKVASARLILSRGTSRFAAEGRNDEDDRGGRRREIVDRSPSPFTDIEFEERLTQALADLPDPDLAKRVVTLVLVNGFTAEEAAKQVRRTPETIKSLIAEASEKIRAVFPRESDTDLRTELLDCVNQTAEVIRALGLENAATPGPGENNWRHLQTAISAESATGEAILTQLVRTTFDPDADDPLAHVLDTVERLEDGADTAVVLLDDGANMHSYLVTNAERRVGGQIVVFDTNITAPDNTARIPRVRTRDTWTQSYSGGEIQEAFVAYLKYDNGNLIARDPVDTAPGRATPRDGEIQGPPSGGEPSGHPRNADRSGRGSDPARAEEQHTASGSPLGSPTAPVPRTVLLHLLQRYMAQDRREEALAVLRRQFGDKVFRWVSATFSDPRMAREITDEAFETALDRLDRIPDRDVEKWIVFVARNLMPKHAGFDRFRHRILHALADTEGAEELRRPLAEATTAELQRAMRAGTLNDRQRANLNRFWPDRRSGGTTQPVPAGDLSVRDRGLWTAVRTFALAIAADQDRRSEAPAGPVPIASARPDDTLGSGESAGHDHKVSEANVEILRLLAAGWTDKRIEEPRHLPPRTVERRLALTARTLGTSGNRTAMVAFAIRNRIIDAPAPPSAVARLQPRDIALLELAAEGKSDREIGEMIGKKGSAVGEYFRDIRMLLGAKTRTEMVAMTLTAVDARRESRERHRQEELRELFPSEQPAPQTLPDPDDPAYDSIHHWLKALRRYFGMKQAEFAEHAGTATATISQMERVSRPRVVVLRTLRDNLGLPNDVIVRALQRFFARPKAKVTDPETQRLFWRLIATRPGSREEKDIQAEIYQKYAWIPAVVATDWAESKAHHQDLAQLGAEKILTAVLNFAPVDDFTTLAWSTARYACMDDYFIRRFPDMDQSTRKLVMGVETYIRRTGETDTVPDTEIAQALGLELAQVARARALLEQRLAASQPLSKQYSALLRQALSDFPDPDFAVHVVRLHFLEGLPVRRVAMRLAIPPEEAQHMVDKALPRLRTALTADTPGTAVRAKQRPAGGHTGTPPGPTTAYTDFGEVDAFGDRRRRGARATHVPADTPADVLAFNVDPNSGLPWGLFGAGARQPEAPGHRHQKSGIAGSAPKQAETPLGTEELRTLREAVLATWDETTSPTIRTEKAHLGRIVALLDELSSSGRKPLPPARDRLLRSFARSVAQWLSAATEADRVLTEAERAAGASTAAHRVRRYAEAESRFAAANRALEKAGTELRSIPTDTPVSADETGLLRKVERSLLVQALGGISAEISGAAVHADNPDPRSARSGAATAHFPSLRRAQAYLGELLGILDSPHTVTTRPRLTALISYADAARHWLAEWLNKNNAARHAIEAAAHERRAIQAVDDFRAAEGRVRDLLAALNALPVLRTDPWAPVRAETPSAPPPERQPRPSHTDGTPPRPPSAGAPTPGTASLGARPAPDPRSLPWAQSPDMPRGPDTSSPAAPSMPTPTGVGSESVVEPQELPGPVRAEEPRRSPGFGRTAESAPSPEAVATAGTLPWMRLPKPPRRRSQELGRAAGWTDVGVGHTVNEDDFALAEAVVGGKPVTLATVCDGVSHLARSDVAAKVASQAACAVLHHAAAGAQWDPVQVVKDAVEAARAAVLELIRTEFDGCEIPPACTIVVTLVTSTEIVTESRGDARAYWVPLDGSPPQRLTVDDSYAQRYLEDAERRGEHLTDEEAEAMPFASTITRGLGNESIWQEPWKEPEPARHTPTGRGVVMLVSDGAVKRVSDEALADVVLSQLEHSPADRLAAAAAVIRTALAEGETDNITAVVMDGPAGAAESAPPRHAVADSGAVTPARVAKVTAHSTVSPWRTTATPWSDGHRRS